MTDTKVSVIVPAYNSEAFLDRCLTSIVNQTYPDLEVLLIDDGSTDGTLALGQSWANRDSRISVFHAENAGVSSARNIGLRNAQGVYICFVDSDDYLDENFVQWHVDRLQNDSQVDISVCGFVDEDDQGTVIHTSEITSHQEYDMRQFNSSYFLPYTCWQIMFRASMLNADGKALLFDQTIHIKEDLLFLYALLARSHKVMVDGNILYHSVYRSSSLSHTALGKEGESDFLSSINVYPQLISVTQKNTALHEFVCANILKDLAKFEDRLDQTGNRNNGLRFEIASIRKEALDFLIHKGGWKMKIQALIVSYLPKLYLKIAR